MGDSDVKRAPPRRSKSPPQHARQLPAGALKAPACHPPNSHTTPVSRQATLAQGCFVRDCLYFRPWRTGIVYLTHLESIVGASMHPSGCRVARPRAREDQMTPTNSSRPKMAMRKRGVAVASAALLSCSGLIVASANVATAAEPDPGKPVPLSESQVAEYKKGQDAAGLGPGLVGPRDSSAMAKEASLDSEKRASLLLKASRTSSVAAVATSKVISVTHSSQSRTYWCGPSAVAMALRTIGVTSPTQTTLAGQLETTTNGTAWSGVNVNTSPSTGRPVKDVLNNRIGSSWYVAVDLSYSPTSTEKSKYRSAVALGITNNHGLVGGAYEVPGGPRLNGHPASGTIWHYVTMTGYSSSGATTRYGDPASGSATSWAGPVPKFSNINSDKLTTILGGRGYVW